MHHARNPKYIDRNYAGVLILWDKLFGSFVEEDPEVPCEFGIVRQVQSHNPITLTFHEWVDMFRDTTSARNWRARLRQLFGPPGKSAAAPGPGVADGEIMPMQIIRAPAPGP